METMEYLEVHGEHIPKIGLGTWQMRVDACRRIVLSALEMGYRHLDTAEYYRNEREVGQAIRESGLERDSLFVTSKVWSNHFQREAVRQACEDSLARLDLDYLDLYLIHHPGSSVPLEETLAGMVDLVEAGKTRYIGVSNFDVSLVEKSRSLVDVPIFTNQVKFHPFHPQRELLEYSQNQELMITAYSPLAQGDVNREGALKRIGERYGKSPAQVALRWVIDHQGVITIPKSSSVDHQRDNLNIFDFQLREEEQERIAGLR